MEKADKVNEAHKTYGEDAARDRGMPAEAFRSVVSCPKGAAWDKGPATRGWEGYWLGNMVSD